jgi:hypothetical protein
LRVDAPSAPATTDDDASARYLRELRLTQKKKLEVYIETLDKQEAFLANQASGGLDDLLTFVELEEKAAQDILAIQKVITPLAGTPQSAKGAASDIDITLENLKADAYKRTLRSKELMFAHMETLKAQLRDVRQSPYLAGNKAFQGAAQGALVDIKS